MCVVPLVNGLAVRCVPVFAWEAYEKGSEVHLQADPTKLELLHQSFKVKKEDFKEKQKDTILERVGQLLFLLPLPVDSLTTRLILTPSNSFVAFKLHA